MKPSLRTKLTLSYVTVVLISVLLISITMNLLLDKHFKDYITQNQERKNLEIVSQITQLYTDRGTWDVASIEIVCINALEQGMIIKVLDSSKTTIWDAMLHDSELCEQMLAHMAENMRSRDPNWEGNYLEKTYPIVRGGNAVGSVIIGYYGPYYFNDGDLAFINTINRTLIGVAFISLILSLLFGTLMSKKLTTPISRVITTAQMISKGYYGDRITGVASTKETAQLTETINNLAETLENQEFLRKRLSADVAHELRTPLATLQSHLEAMIDGIWEPDADRLRSVHEEIMRMSRMVGDLEKLTKYESESLILIKTDFDLSELFRQILQNFESDFANKGIELSFVGETQRIRADKDKISQAIINLLSNALKYTAQGGKVQVKVSGTDQFSEWSVADSGMGIPPKDLPHIFERFYRADPSRNRMTGGAGIGLTITKSIIDAHKGKIDVQSTVGAGTTFVVKLPKKLNS